MPDSPFRALPSVDALLREPALERFGDPALVTEAARRALESARREIAAGARPPTHQEMISDIARRVEDALELPLRPLINATGVIIHTNLGRAPLADEAIAAMAAVSRGYSNLEYETESGTRGSRHGILEPLLCRLTGAEAAMAVNNNASAVLLALSAIAAGKDVIISRGQLVEIGGGFRIPDVMRQSRAKLVEVGTTNRTRIGDYAEAVTPKTAAFMRVHTSNFRVVGFTESASLEELAAAARIHNVRLLDDLGSGCLLDTTAYGLSAEPRPQESIAAGADVALFSGDKLLGGPQGGLIVGKRDAIDRMKRHPLARAVRLDKASIAGLAATLLLYVQGTAPERVPVWRMIALGADAIRARAATIAGALGEDACVVDGRSTIGGGSLPEETLPTHLVALSRRPGITANALAANLRTRAVVPRIENGRVLLDPRTVAPAEDARLIEACTHALRDA